MKKILKRTGKVFCLFLLIVVLVNVLLPLFCRKPDEKYVENLKKTEFTSETAGVERICCIDDNEEALLWRLRMIGTAKESIVLSTFDLRADDNGTKILAALNCAAARGVKIQLLIDGIYQQLFLAGSSDFQALASYENVEVGVYNPVTPVNLFKVNYRMHDKYLIVDEKMYLLGGRMLVNIFMNEPSEAAMASGVQFLRIVSPFYFLVSCKLVSDGVLRGAGLMKEFMVATFTDLILRVGLAIGLSKVLGVTGVWCAWPIGWTIAMVLSVLFYRRGPWEKQKA